MLLEKIITRPNRNFLTERFFSTKNGFLTKTIFSTNIFTVVKMFILVGNFFFEKKFETDFLGGQGGITAQVRKTGSHKNNWVLLKTKTKNCFLKTEKFLVSFFQR